MAKKGSRKQTIQENLQKLENLIDPDGFFQREWERNHNLQMAHDHYMVLSRHVHERVEKAKRRTRLKIVRKETQGA